MHNDYLLTYFSYLTEVTNLEFSKEGLLFLIISSYLVLSKRLRKDSFQIIYQLLEIIFFAPLITYLSFTNYITSGFYISILLSFLVYKYNIGAKRVNIEGFVNERFIEVFAFITLFVSVVFVSKFKFNLDFSAIYDVRETFAEKTPGVLRYFVSWSAYFSVPYLLLRAINYYKTPKKITLLFFLIVQLLLFSIGNNKSFLVVYLTVFFYTIFEKNSGFKLDWNILKNYTKFYVGLLLVLFSIVFYFPSYYIIASFIFLRTVSLAPRQLDLYYKFVHVLDNDLTFLAQNFPFRYIFNYPHSDVLGKIVSQKVLGIESNANAAFLFSDGIASFGIYIGPIISFILFNFVLSMIFINPKINQKIRVLLSVPLLIQILNTSILVAFITGGGLLIMVLGMTKTGVKAINSKDLLAK